MKYANLISPSRKLCFAMALAAGMVAIPLPTMANQAVQNVQQSGVVKGQVVDKSGEPIIGATIKVKKPQVSWEEAWPLTPQGLDTPSCLQGPHSPQSPTYMAAATPGYTDLSRLTCKGSFITKTVC